MENAINVVRVTKAQKLEAIKAAIPADFKREFPGDDKKQGFTFDHAAVMEFLDYEIALLAKKNSGDKKLTKVQEANEKYKQNILDYLAGLVEDSDGATCTEMFKAIPAFAEYSPNKVSALCRQLKMAELITSKEIKGKTFFRLA